MKTIASILLLLLVIVAGVTSYSLHRYRSPSVAADAQIVIARGTGVRATLAQLHAQQVLPAPWKIVGPLLLSGDYRSLKAGEYAFRAGESPRQVIGKLARGEVVVHALTIPEGWNVAQVRDALLNEPLLSGEVPADISEGSVMPDTVHFARGDSRASILARLQEAQRTLLGEAWQRRAEGLPLANANEALVLASIVEAETGVPHERPTVAAVYINRLRRGMKLQADPTVAYGIAPQGMTRPLSRADLKRDTPYNTYTRTGLPPGPICNPGRAAIEATLQPASSDALFFVATGNGGHWFAPSEAEHRRNVAKYRAIRRTKQQ